MSLWKRVEERIFEEVLLPLTHLWRYSSIIAPGRCSVRVATAFLWFCLGVFVILLNILFARPAYPHSSSLDTWGCHYDQRGYHCHEGQFAGQHFESKMEMLSAEPEKKTEEKAATETKELTIWEIDAKIEEHFRRLDEEREAKEKQARKEKTAKQALSTEDSKQTVKDPFPFFLVVERNNI